MIWVVFFDGRGLFGVAKYALRARLVAAGPPLRLAGAPMPDAYGAPPRESTATVHTK